MSETEPAEPTGTGEVPTYHPGRVLTRILASLWSVVSLFAGLNFINGTEFVTYGGDAYTGIQNAVARGTTALGFLIISSGVIAVIVAFRRDGHGRP